MYLKLGVDYFKHHNREFDEGDDDFNSYGTVSAYLYVEICSILPTFYGMVRYRMWANKNNQSTREKLPFTHVATILFNILVVITSVYYHQKNALIFYATAMFAVITLVMNVIFLYGSIQYVKEYYGIEDEDEHQKTRIRLSIDEIWAKYDTDKND